MRTVGTKWEGREVEAAWPEPIATVELGLSASTIRATAGAEAAVATSGRTAAGTSEVVARLLLRAEGLSSSMIEGLRVSPAELALAEADPRLATGDPGWVADNLAVVAAALETTGPLTTDLVLEWHRRLMRHAPSIGEVHVGAWRDRLGWVGGANPLVAAHVATPPELIEDAMADLVEFVNRDDVDPVTSAAVAHAQFETIHPFADGNGRLGRVLVARTLAHGIGVATPPPVSTRFARDIGGYLSGLALYQQDSVDAWVRWFAGAVSAASVAADGVFAAVTDVQTRWALACDDLRRDSAARRLLDVLGDHPVLDTVRVVELLGVSDRAARGALTQLGERGVLSPTVVASVGRGRSPRWWCATDLLALAGL